LESEGNIVAGGGLEILGLPDAGLSRRLLVLIIGGTLILRITFDPQKRQTTLRDRGLDFSDAKIAFAGLTLTVQDMRRDYGEVRFQTVGLLAGRMVMIVWTPRGEVRHIISMRKCNDREKEIYQKRFDQG
jgi:uncharacterized protein